MSCGVGFLCANINILSLHSKNCPLVTFLFSQYGSCNQKVSAHCTLRTDDNIPLCIYIIPNSLYETGLIGFF